MTVLRGCPIENTVSYSVGNASPLQFAAVSQLLSAPRLPKQYPPHCGKAQEKKYGDEHYRSMFPHVFGLQGGSKQNRRMICGVGHEIPPFSGDIDCYDLLSTHRTASAITNARTISATARRQETLFGCSRMGNQGGCSCRHPVRLEQ